MADYSYLTGDVSTSPPGRAVAIFQHGFGVELFDFEQAIMVGADGDTYRRVDVAEDRAGSETQGDPAPMLLSPDGIAVAVGDWDADEPDLAVVDLSTGETEVHQVPGGRSALPLAWSPDSSLVTYLSTAEPKYPYSGSAITGHIGVLETESGEARIMPGVADVRAAAFSPDGAELAIHRLDLDEPTGTEDGDPHIGGGVIEVVGLDGDLHRQLNMDADEYLDGPNAWSPDGALLATGRQGLRTDALTFVDASGGDAPVPEPLKTSEVSHHGLLGWTESDEVLVLIDGTSAGVATVDGEPEWLTALALDGSDSRRLSSVPSGGNFGVGGFQLAAGLIPNLEVREPGRVDRGRLPMPFIIASSMTLAIAALLAARFTQRRLRGRP